MKYATLLKNLKTTKKRIERLNLKQAKINHELKLITDQTYGELFKGIRIKQFKVNKNGLTRFLIGKKWYVVYCYENDDSQNVIGLREVDIFDNISDNVFG